MTTLCCSAPSGSVPCQVAAKSGARSSVLGAAARIERHAATAQKQRMAFLISSNSFQTQTGSPTQEGMKSAAGRSLPALASLKCDPGKSDPGKVHSRPLIQPHLHPAAGGFRGTRGSRAGRRAKPAQAWNWEMLTESPAPAQSIALGDFGRTLRFAALEECEAFDDGSKFEPLTPPVQSDTAPACHPDRYRSSASTACRDTRSGTTGRSSLRATFGRPRGTSAARPAAPGSGGNPRAPRL